MTGQAEREPPDARAAGPPHEVDRADFDPGYDPDEPILCEICGSVMEYTASCRIICRNCGYTRDCTDP